MFMLVGASAQGGLLTASPPLRVSYMEIRFFIRGESTYARMMLRPNTTCSVALGMGEVCPRYW